VSLRDLSFLAVVLMLPAGVWAQARNQNLPPTASGPVTVEAPKANPNAAEVVGGSGLSVDTKSYVIGPEDILFIRVWREAEFTSQYGVRPDGKITLPLIKDVQAGGLTPDKLGDNLTQQLSEFLNKPEVVVSVIQVNSKKYFVTGEVNRAGQFSLVTPITIFDALSAAGGFHEFANKKDVVVIRGSERLHFNYEEHLKGKGGKGKKGKGNENFFMESGDTIVVK
jgi:polysaccharide export outer membrane protein